MQKIDYFPKQSLIPDSWKHHKIPKLQSTTGPVEYHHQHLKRHTNEVNWPAFSKAATFASQAGWRTSWTSLATLWPVRARCSGFWRKKSPNRGRPSRSSQLSQSSQVRKSQSPHRKGSPKSSIWCTWTGPEPWSKWSNGRRSARNTKLRGWEISYKTTGSSGRICCPTGPASWRTSPTTSGNGGIGSFPTGDLRPAPSLARERPGPGAFLRREERFSESKDKSRIWWKIWNTQSSWTIRTRKN